MSTQKSAIVALSFLPPDIQSVMKAHGFTPWKIESTGSLRLVVSDEASIEKKTEMVTSLRRALKDYGLDLHRVLGESAISGGVDRSCLIVKRGASGAVLPLFKDNGEPYPELPGEDTGFLAHDRGSNGDERSAGRAR